MPETWYATSRYNDNIEAVSVIKETPKQLVYVMIEKDWRTGEPRKVEVRASKDGIFQNKHEAVAHIRGRLERSVEGAMAQLSRAQSALDKFNAIY